MARVTTQKRQGQAFLIEHVESVPLEAILILIQPQVAFNVHQDKTPLEKEAQTAKRVRIYIFILCCRMYLVQHLIWYEIKNLKSKYLTELTVRVN